MIDRAINTLKDRHEYPPVEFVPDKFYITRYNLILYVTGVSCEWKGDSVHAYWATNWGGLESYPVRKSDLVAYASKTDIRLFHYLYNYCYDRELALLEKEMNEIKKPQKEWNDRVDHSLQRIVD